jgi:hypothetical protein
MLANLVVKCKLTFEDSKDALEKQIKQHKYMLTTHKKAWPEPRFLSLRMLI